MGKRELIALLNLSSWCLVMVKRLFLAVPGGCLQFVIVVFPDHTHLLFLVQISQSLWQGFFIAEIPAHEVPRSSGRFFLFQNHKGGPEFSDPRSGS